MAVWTGQENTSAVIQAGREWAQKCFLSDGSILSDASLWTHEHFAKLKEHFVDNPVEGDQSFYEKLSTEVKEASYGT